MTGFLEFLGLRTVTLTVQHPVQKDRHGDPIPDSAPPDTPLPGWMVAPRESSENADEALFVGLTAYGPAGASVSPYASVLVPGYDGVWQVYGLPGRWDLHGPPGGVEIRLKQVV